MLAGALSEHPQFTETHAINGISVGAPFGRPQILKSQRLYFVGAHYSKAAYSIAIQIKDLVRCLSVRPTIIGILAGERNSPLQNVTATNHARNNSAGIQTCNGTRGRPLQQVAYSIAIQIKDLVRCLSCGAHSVVGLCPTPCQRRRLWTLPKGHSPFGIPMFARQKMQRHSFSAIGAVVPPARYATTH